MNDEERLETLTESAVENSDKRVKLLRKLEGSNATLYIPQYNAWVVGRLYQDQEGGGWKVTYGMTVFPFRLHDVDSVVVAKTETYINIKPRRG